MQSTPKRKTTIRPGTLSNMTSAYAEKIVRDKKLFDQFKYFRKELMEQCLASDVTIPLDILEDESGHFFSFIQNKGALYVFQIIQTNKDNINLLRTCASLLIIIVTILETKKSSAKKIRAPGRQSLAFAGVNSENLGTWIVKSLSAICNMNGVQIILEILISSTSVL